MGGPCFLLVEDGSTPPTEHFKSGVKWAPANPPRRRISGPACTDNFQVAPFMFDGAEWQSVEQCYQAYKFNNIQAREHIRAMVKLSSETDHGHGMRVWAAGGSRNGGTLRSDWDAVKIEVMLRACRAKLVAHPVLCSELLDTGEVQIVGAPSTDWQGITIGLTPQSLPLPSCVWKASVRLSRVAGVTGYHNWSTWNGRIQMLLREELKSRQQTEPGDSEALATLKRTFTEYMAAEGGSQHPLPES